MNENESYTFKAQFNFAHSFDSLIDPEAKELKIRIQQGINNNKSQWEFNNELMTGYLQLLTISFFSNSYFKDWKQTQHDTYWIHALSVAYEAYEEDE